MKRVLPKTPNKSFSLIEDNYKSNRNSYLATGLIGSENSIRAASPLPVLTGGHLDVSLHLQVYTNETKQGYVRQTP